MKRRKIPRVMSWQILLPAVCAVTATLIALAAAEIASSEVPYRDGFSFAGFAWACAVAGALIFINVRAWRRARRGGVMAARRVLLAQLRRMGDVDNTLWISADGEGEPVLTLLVEVHKVWPARMVAVSRIGTAAWTALREAGAGQVSGDRFVIWELSAFHVPWGRFTADATAGLGYWDETPGQVRRFGRRRPRVGGDASGEDLRVLAGQLARAEPLRRPGGGA